MNGKVLGYLTAIVLCLPHLAAAQGFIENALLFSRTRPGGSARIQALGGAQVALGGDFSSALSNPAGLGMYNRSEFTFSPALNAYNTSATHLDNSTNDSKNVFNVPGLSYVFNSPKNTTGYIGGSFGISMARTNDFNRTFTYAGTDNLSSIVDWFIEDAYGFTPEQLPDPYASIPLLNYDYSTGQSYLTFLINTLADDQGNTTPVMPDDYIEYYSELEPIPGETRTLDRIEQVSVKGSQYQWSLAYGGNYNDKLFFGANIGITSLRYTFKRKYREQDFDFSDDPSYNPLDYLELEERITIDGSGLNLTLGLIYRPADVVQLGMALVTPTYYQLTDSYTSVVRTLWNDSRAFIEEESAQPLVSEYSLTTPLKLSLGTAVFLGSYGFIAGDVEFVNYGKAKYRSDISGISFSPDNEGIREFFTNTVNYRIGAEFRYEKLRLRAGYNIQSNPLRDNDSNLSIKTLSAGIGLRLSKFFTDLTWLTSTGESFYSPYLFQDGTGPLVKLDNTVNSLMLTVGFTF
ncbi:MAG: hypothetical protein HRU69_01710 [Flammeovirgaceae bacterium]|nr:MAG: hypothetical protein HRU69_01710 [Flammeovirgaceae bacterium]